MKNQYSADRNDYFKYDLCIFLAERLAGIKRFTFIPILTADDQGGDGGKTSYPLGTGQESLYSFLQQSLKDGRGEVAQLRRCFGTQPFTFKYCPYRGYLRPRIHP